MRGRTQSHRFARASRPPARRLLAAVVTVGCSVVLLTGCGEDKPSPFQAPGEPEAAVSDLGFPVLATRNTTRTSTDDPVDAAAAVARAVYSGGAEESKAPAVTLVDRNDWRTALAATALMAPPLGAPILFTDGKNLPKATKAAIEALGPTGSEPAGGRAQVIRIGEAARVDGLRETNIEGADPYALALGIDRFAAAARRRASSRVVVVSADAPEYAAPAAAWAAKTGDPIAFVTRKGIPAGTARLLRDHQDPAIFVLGPSKVIPPAVSKALRKFGTVRRVGGQDPVSNAIAFARFHSGTFGWNINEPGHGFTFARSNDVLSAVTVAPFSATGLHGPLLQLDTANVLPPALQQFLLNFRPGYQTDPTRGVYNRGWISGSPEAITPALQSQLDVLLEIAPVNNRAPRAPAAPTAPTTTGTTTAPTPPPARAK